jgi:DNA-binding NarL/FixJ family response regulator
VLLAEDETVLRVALAQLIGAEEGIDVVAVAGDGETAVNLARQWQPDVVLMDLGMPRLDGIAATRAIRELLPACAIVVLTIHSDDEHVFGAIKAGATGYVLKSAPPDRTVEAIRAAAEGDCFLSPPLLTRVIAEFNRLSGLRAAAKEVFAELTRRELEILELLGQGLRNRDIAQHLFVSEKTVKNHVSSILAKLHVNDRTEAAILANRHGLTDPPG